jgi:hypothetical protein
MGYLWREGLISVRSMLLLQKILNYFLTKGMKSCSTIITCISKLIVSCNLNSPLLPSLKNLENYQFKKKSRKLKYLYLENSPTLKKTNKIKLMLILNFFRINSSKML